MNLLNMESAIVPVTGAASGIGLAICKRLKSAGATPLLLDFNAQTLASAVREVFPDASGDSRLDELNALGEAADKVRVGEVARPVKSVDGVKG